MTITQWRKITECGYQGFEGTLADLYEIGLDEDADPKWYRFYRDPVKENRGGWYMYQYDGQWLIPNGNDEACCATLEEAERKLTEVVHSLSGDRKLLPMLPSNIERAQRIAAEGIHYYMKSKVCDTLPDAVTDILTDLMHFCHMKGLDFENQLRIANGHYRTEASGLADEEEGVA